MARAATQPTAGEYDQPWDGASEHRVTASEWFASGARRPYDPIAKTPPCPPMDMNRYVSPR